MDNEPAVPSSSWPPALPPVASRGLSLPGGLDDPLALLDSAPSRPIDARVALRALRRYWWQMLLLWMVGSLGLVALIHNRIRPGYEATAWLEVKPVTKYALAAPTGPTPDMDLFMQTQVQLLTSPDVLGKALLDPRVVGLSLVREAVDPRARLRELLRVTIPPRTTLILVGITTPQREDGPIIVNAVVDAYLAEASTWTDEETRKQLEQLRIYKERYRNDVERHRRELEQIVEKRGGADPDSPLQVEADRYRQFKAQLNKIELERMEAEVTLAVLRDSRRPDQANPATPRRPSAETLLEQAYQRDPEVLALHAEMKQAQDALDQTFRAARKKGGDAAAVLHRERLAKLQREEARLRAAKFEELRAQIDTQPEETDPLEVTIRAAEFRLAKLQQEEARVRAEVEAIHIESRNEGRDALEAQFATNEMNSATELYRRVSLMLEQLQAEVHGAARISRISVATPAQLPTRDNRLALMATAPLGLLVALAGLFVLVEARAARVADPDDVTARLRLGVIGIVPPLPPAHPGRSPKALRDQRRKVEEYVQSLDHLRVTLCASARTGARRCVMITSASGGEGKTTLAAQLAGRCANAGLSTLLVDADLRRPALGALLEVPQGAGLAEVLRGAADPEDVLVALEGAGGFHLLPAGIDRLDPSRILQGDRLGQVIGRLRESFDVVIVDVPPLLPVPDALLIGRWTDGAIVAVRHDTSRFPLVERAQRKLTAMGIPILGAVVNGCRPSAASYGAYGYYGDGPHDTEIQPA